MITIRDFYSNDVFDIEDIHNSINDFPMTNLNSPCKILNRTVLVDDRVVGIAYVQLTTRVGMILNPSLPILTRAKIIKEIFLEFIKEMEQTQIEDVHIFIDPKDEMFANLLKNNFGFECGKEIELFRRINYVPTPQFGSESTVGTELEQPSTNPIEASPRSI